MRELTKNKILGQYYSGEFVARLLCSFLDIHPHMDIIDPMAGIGDMLVPFLEGGHSLSAVEIDPEAHGRLTSIVPSAVLGNAFSKEQFNYYRDGGYDLVITNPPYVRRELLNASSNLPFYLSQNTILENLKDFAQRANTLSAQERVLFLKTIDRFSKLSDLAIPSWLLCILLTKPGGQLALVVPASWLTREYSKPLLLLLNDFFDIQSIIKDVNSCLFEGKALVQTNLIVAKRKTEKSSAQNDIRIFSLYKSFLKSAECLAHLASGDVRNNGCDVQVVSQNDFNFTENSNNEFVKKSSFLSKIIDIEYLNTIGLNDLGVVCNQGFRSGANSFFYFTKEGDSFVSNYRDVLPSSCVERYFVGAIQNQEDLTGAFNQRFENYHFLLCIRDSVRSQDLPTNSQYKLLPNVLTEYINQSENRFVKGTRIPELSAVRTNQRPASKGNEPRFWYMLPPFTPRHRANLFMPRVNSGRTYVYHNIEKSVIDANFITFSFSEKRTISPYGLLALLNSTWSAIQLEEIGSVMGGGALKIDSVQLSKLFFPAFNEKELVSLERLGKILSCQATKESQSIIKRIDKVILGATGVECSSLIWQKLYAQSTLYITRRYGSQ